MGGVLMGYEFKMEYDWHNLISLVYLCNCMHNFIQLRSKPETLEANWPFQPPVTGTVLQMFTRNI